MNQDFQLVKLCQEGDRDAFRILVEKYQEEASEADGETEREKVKPLASR